MKGHSSRITGVEFIDQGRNFITCGSDGLCLLYETSSGQVISKILDGGAGKLNCISISKFDEKIDTEEKPDLFFGSGLEYCWIGSETGELIAISIVGKERLYHESFATAINCITTSDNTTFAGTDSGDIIIITTNNHKVIRLKCILIYTVIFFQFFATKRVSIGSNSITNIIIKDDLR